MLHPVDDKTVSDNTGALISAKDTKNLCLIILLFIIMSRYSLSNYYKL
nr:hypothetical protein [Mycoplasmopsis bovis]